MIRLLLIVCSCALLLPHLAFGDIVHIEDFEDDTGYGVTPSEFTNNSTQYFVRSNFTNINNNVNYNVVQGSFFFGAQQVHPVSTDPVELNITNIDISGESTLFFSGFFAEDDALVFLEEDWDADDYLHISYRIDGVGVFQDLFWIESAGPLDTVAMVDTDFDGIGDGDIITSDFTQFFAPIVGTGSTLELLVEISLDAREEDIAFDNLAILNSLPISGVPEPGMFVLSGLMTLSLAARRRRK
jgi:hypothetical protein